ncbi:MAG: (4Fe-4S)-binding protein [Actinomycetia bacterium]|nr:(4Fe-4S)-binding protein [Actinomycetes bacterium]
MTKREYPADKLTVTWDSQTCIHSGICARALPGVFRPKERPWIDVAGATDEQIALAIDACPSGALGYRWHDTAQSPVESEVRASQPNQTEPETMADDVTIQPLPDGPYEILGLVDLLDADGEVVRSAQKLFLCRCGASKTKPYCDGSHKEIGFKA